jgi:hypothetical protein
MRDEPQTQRSENMKTILAVAIVIAGFAYAANAFPPGGNSGSDCSTPQPEDLRVYRVVLPDFEEPFVIIPKVEGANGFILTDAFAITGMEVYQDTGAGPVRILTVHGSNANDYRFSPVPGLPLVPGSIITVSGGHLRTATIIGYVY